LSFCLSLTNWVLETIVNNESSEILRMFYTAFDHLLPESLRESSKGANGLRPAHLVTAIDAMNDWVYDTINNGVYRCGFATSQEAYEEAIYPLFKSLDRLEEHLADPRYAGPFLFGEHITDADIRLYPTIIRFDIGYYILFKVNIKMIRHDYPRLYKWLRTLYWDQSATTRAAFNQTTLFDRVSVRYHLILVVTQLILLAVQIWLQERHRGANHPSRTLAVDP